MVATRRGASPLDRSGETWNFLYRLAQHWPLALVVGLGLAGGGFLYAQRYQPLYHAEAQVRVGESLDAKAVPGQREDQSEMLDLPENLAAGFRARFIVDAKLLRVLDELAEDPELKGYEPLQTVRGREQLADHVKRFLMVDPVTRRVFRVSYDGQNADFVYKVVQRLAELGVEDVIEQRGITARQARQFLSAEAESARRRLLATEQEMVRFVKQNPGLRAGGERKAGMQVGDKLLLNRSGLGTKVSPLREVELGNLSPEVRALAAQKAELEAQVQQLEASSKADPVSTKLAEAERLNQQLSELKAQNYTQEYPEFRRITGEIERVQQEIQEAKSKKNTRLTQDMRRLSDARVEIAALEKQMAASRRKAAGTPDENNPGPADERSLSAEATYARLVKDLETLRGAYDKLHDREVEAQINEELSKVKGNLAARIEEAAKRPDLPRGVSRRLMTLLCILLGLFGGLLVAVLRSLTDPTIYTVFDLAKASKLPVLGRVPRRDDSPAEALTDVSEEVSGAAPAHNLGEAPERTLITSSGRVSERHQISSGSMPVSGPHREVPARTHSSLVEMPKEWTNEYMVVYRETTHPGLRIPTTEREDSSITDLAQLGGGGQLQGLSGDGRVLAPMGPGHSSRRLAPQSVGFRLTGMGHTLQPGQLPSEPNLFLVSAPDGARAEQYRLLRCRLQDLGDPRVLVLTSALRGEGKTIAAANLALAYAEGGAHSVALVDAHLSSPRLTELMGALPRSEPLTENDVMKGGLHLWQYGQNLYLVPAQGPRVKRSAVLSSPAFAMLVADLRQLFDYVIIDAPAVATSADTKILLRTADVGLFLTRARQTTGKAVEVALDRLGRRGVAGVVLNEFG